MPISLIFERLRRYCFSLPSSSFDCAWELGTPLERVRASNPFSSCVGGWRWRGILGIILSCRGEIAGWAEASA